MCVFDVYSALSTQHLKAGNSTLIIQHPTRNTQQSTLNTQQSPLTAQRSTLNTQYSTLNTQGRTLDDEAMATALQTPNPRVICD